MALDRVSEAVCWSGRRRLLRLDAVRLQPATLHPLRAMFLVVEAVVGVVAVVMLRLARRAVAGAISKWRFAD